MAYSFYSWQFALIRGEEIQSVVCCLSSFIWHLASGIGSLCSVPCLLPTVFCRLLSSDPESVQQSLDVAAQKGHNELQKFRMFL